MNSVLYPFVHTGLSLGDEIYGVFSHLKFYIKNYGVITGLILWIFGSGEVWKIQLQVLNDASDEVAIEFKECTIRDNNMVAITGTILAQVAITAFALDSMGQTHWVAKGFLIFCLVSAMIAVYYASGQCRILGRCFRPCDVREWIMNDTKLRKAMYEGKAQPRWVKERLPSSAAVLTMSAPGMLLTASLHSFLIGMGVYFGFLWTNNLGADAGLNDNRSNFITYVVSLGVCYGVYMLSRTVSTCQRDFEKLTSSGRAKRFCSERGETYGNTDIKNDVEHAVKTVESRGSDVTGALLHASSLHKELAAAHDRLGRMLEEFPIGK